MMDANAVSGQCAIPRANGSELLSLKSDAGERVSRRSARTHVGSIITG